MEKIALEIELDEDVIVSNLRDNKGHVELLMAKMKMQHTVHDFFEYGMNFADIYLTLVTHWNQNHVINNLSLTLAALGAHLQTFLSK